MKGDMNMDPPNGLGRTLFAALAQFAEVSRHPELASAKVILLGFSGAGSLVGRFPEYASDRMLAVVASDPGHYDPWGVNTIALSPKASVIPQLVLVGSDDATSGTERPYAYFRKYFDQGAPWTFLVQNGTPTLLHHQRQSAGFGVARRSGHTANDAAHRLVRIHHNSGKRRDGMPSSPSTCSRQSHSPCSRSSRLVSWGDGYMGYNEPACDRGESRGTADPA